MGFYRGLRNGLLLVMPFWVLLFASAACARFLFNGCPSWWGDWSDNAAVLWPGTYEIAHGDSRGFSDGCNSEGAFYAPVDVPVDDVAFFASCGAMGQTGPGTLSSRAHWSVGYHNMAQIQCSLCWSRSLSWQDAFFRNRFLLGNVASYDITMERYPECRDCIKYFSRDSYTIGTAVVPYLLEQM